MYHWWNGKRAEDVVKIYRINCSGSIRPPITISTKVTFRSLHLQDVYGILPSHLISASLFHATPWMKSTCNSFYSSELVGGRAPRGNFLVCNKATGLCAVTSPWIWSPPTASLLLHTFLDASHFPRIGHLSKHSTFQGVENPLNRDL